VLGQTISRIDPETGDILSALSIQNGVLFADDLVFDNEGAIYWTEFALGSIYKLPTPLEGGTGQPIFPLGTYPNVNPLVFSEDYKRLYFGQCFNEAEPLGIYELNLETGETTTIVDGIPICSSNSMDILDNVLYSPRIYESRVVRIDLNNNNTVTDVATGMERPDAVKFDSQGNLYVTDSCKVYQIDMTNEDKSNNRVMVAGTLQADPPFSAIDNLIFDNDDRLYISSVARGSVLEVLGVDVFRTVSPGQFSLASGIAL
jgi:hypothetical protein